MISDAREVRTARLVLCAPVPADRAEVIEIQADPETHRHNPMPPAPEETAEQFERWLAHWRVHGFGYWVARDAGFGRAIGLGGVQTKDLDGEPVLNLFYRFRPEVWGNGYAVELGQAAVELAERTTVRPVVIITDLSNTPARRVAGKLGFTLEKEADYLGAPCAYYRR